jgi:hypothetical protein
VDELHKAMTAVLNNLHMNEFWSASTDGNNIEIPVQLQDGTTSGATNAVQNTI